MSTPSVSGVMSTPSSTEMSQVDKFIHWFYDRITFDYDESSDYWQIREEGFLVDDSPEVPSPISSTADESSSDVDEGAAEIIFFTVRLFVEFSSYFSDVNRTPKKDTSTVKRGRSPTTITTTVSSSNLKFICTT